MPRKAEYNLDTKFKCTLDQRMRELGFNAKSLSRAAGLNETAIRDIMQDRIKSPTVDTINSIADALEIAYSDLVNATEPKRHNNDRLVYIKELDARAGGGMLAHNDDDTVVETWGIPVSALDQYMRDPDAVRIIRVTGDSMSPNYRPGQRIFVDITDNTPSPPGVFIVWDGMGTVIKRCEHIMQSDPPRLLLTSDNKDYQSYELTADEAGIIGRVIGKLELC